MRRAKTVALCGLLIAVAFVINWLEAMLPPLIPLPGVKPGLANVVTLFALYRLTARHAALILIGRCLLSALLFTGPTQLLFALTGGFLALGAMCAAVRFRAFSPYGVSMLGAAAHNLGQTAAAALLMQNIGLFSYLTVLLPASIPTGLLTAMACILCLRVKPHENP